MILFNLIPKNKKANLFIIGAQKCGTNSMFEYLKLHPSFQPSKNKEINYFNTYHNYEQGVTWYHANWENMGKRKIYYEATPGYWYYSFCPERMAKYNPEAKFICLVRDPVTRAYSAYNMYRQMAADTMNRERLLSKFFKHRLPENEDFFQKMFFNPNGFMSFGQYVTQELGIIEKKKQNEPEPSFIRRGLYLEQLERFYKYFPKESFLIIEQNELATETTKVLNNVCNFVKIKPVKWNESAIKTKHYTREYDESMDGESFNTLRNFYTKPNSDFFSHIGRKFNWVSNP